MPSLDYLPDVLNPFPRKFEILQSLDYPPDVSTNITYNISIGYDCFTCNYKVVVVSCYQFLGFIEKNYKICCKTQVRAHTLGTNFWKRIPDFPSEITGLPEECPGKFVSGTINWAIEDQEKYYLWVILSLDLGNESYQVIPHPEYGLDEPLVYLNLSVSKDCLCVVAHTNSFLDIWLMKVYGNKDSWTKLFTIPFEKLIGCPLPASLLYIAEEGDLVFLDLFDNVYIYNYKNGNVKIPDIQGLPSNSFNSIVYFESLISP
ncbi:putative F-box associated interaction domain-containing protein [Medicago truncatula]|uniref:F-box protein interaction domain protein n=1 Tax=Medicago truncatula TaxID=3880 RepID=G7JKE1_MEDTR|nr:F-box protein interaction domain protein [Medicago truncatula]RHN65006.1 putative F-box associated interaction domain-containing protein [Medicago truncatula]